MKQKFKVGVSTFLLGAILCTGAVYADEAVKAISGVLSPTTKVYTDTGEVTFSHTPINVDGTIYLPVRDVATAVGKDVTYDANTKAITLADPTTTGAAITTPVEPVPLPTEVQTEPVSEETTEAFTETTTESPEVVESKVEQPDNILEGKPDIEVEVLE